MIKLENRAILIRLKRCHLPQHKSVHIQSLVILGGMMALALPTPLAAQDFLSTFDEVAETVESQFFDPTMNDIDWAGHVAAYRGRIDPNMDMDMDTFADVINEMLSALNASHTQFYMRDSPQWYQLAGVFLPSYTALRDDLDPYLADGVPSYVGIGVFVDRRPEGDFVIGVLDGHPAAVAGVFVGDRIVSVQNLPFHPLGSFEERAGQSTRLVVERSPGNTMPLDVTPVLLDGGTMFEDAMRDSVQLVQRDDTAVGYIHVWSYAGQKYHDLLTATLLYGALKNADALVLDLRGGWGGANSSYLNLFAAPSVGVTSVARDGQMRRFASAWDKPVVLLVDEGSRSGKEVFAHGFRALGLGPIVGETTAGAVMAGRINALADGSLLYVAVADTRVNGVRLEGHGVAPDIEVPFDPVFAAGNDPQLDRAITVASELVERQDQDGVSP